MKKLVIMKDQKAVTSSLQVAENFEKEHRNVTRDIESLKKDVLNFEQMFFESEEPDSYNRLRKVVYMNRKGFVLLVMGYTGKKALQFKEAYIDAFDEMENHIKQASIPMSQEDMMISILTSQKEEKKKLRDVEKDIDQLKNEIDLSRLQKSQLSKMVRKNVMDAVGGKKSNAYKELYRVAIAEHWREIKNYFEVASYEEIPKIRFEEAMEATEVWRPSMELQLKIRKLNTQIEMEV